MKEGDTAMKEYPISQARPKLSPLLDQVEQGDVAVIERRGFKALVVRLDDEQELLARCYGFTPEVRMDPSGAAHIWLPELKLNAQGASLDEAEEDLVVAALDYVEDWLGFLRKAPNHADRAGYVQRLRLAGDPEQVRDMLFPAWRRPRDDAHADVS